MNVTQQAKAQNDVADFLRKVVTWLMKLIHFFDDDLPTSQALSPCEQAFVDDLKAELLGVAARLPASVQRYIHCRLGIAPTPAPTGPLQPLGADAQAGLPPWLVPILMNYLKQYLPQIIEMIVAELMKRFGSGAIPPVAPPSNPPVGPLQPSGYSPRQVQRC